MIPLPVNQPKNRLEAEHKELEADHLTKMVELLKRQLQNLHFLLGEGNVLKEHHIIRCSSQTRLPFFNAVFGIPSDSEKAIKEQIAYFSSQHSSFVWFVEEKETEFEERLTAHDFKCIGTFQGMVRDLSLPITNPTFPREYRVEKVQSVDRLRQLNETLCAFLQVSGVTKQLRNQFYESEFNQPSTPLSHWIVLHNNEIVSTLCRVSFGQVSIFMNGVTDPNFRQKQLFTNLRRHVLQDTAREGGQFVLGYLNQQAMAKTICLNEKSIVYWRYKPFIKTVNP